MKRVALSLLTLTVLCSACARPVVVTEPVIIYPARCARPSRPTLPALSGIAFLESMEAYTRLKMRDHVMRTYIYQLEDALDCYEGQLAPEEGENP